MMLRVTPSATSEHNPGWLDSIVNPHVLRCFLRPSLTEAPSLRRSYPAPSVLPSLPCSPSFVAVFKLGLLCTQRTWHSVISFLCCSACTKTVVCDCDLATDSFGSGSLEFGPIGARPAHCETGDRHRLAPPRLSAVLEMEEQSSSWSTICADGSPEPDPNNEFSESTLGRNSKSPGPRPVICVWIGDVNRAVKLASLIMPIEQEATFRRLVISPAGFCAKGIGAQSNAIGFQHPVAFHQHELALTLQHDHLLGNGGGKGDIGRSYEASSGQPKG
jgi:hypothetical protein